LPLPRFDFALLPAVPLVAVGISENEKDSATNTESFFRLQTSSESLVCILPPFVTALT
jgi:hypothetical protein